MNKTKVTFAYPYTDSAGKEHKPESTTTLDFFEARTVINNGIARVADAEAPKPDPKGK